MQVLAAQRMLQDRGIAGVIYLGATIDKKAEENMRAHAWLKCDDQFITGEQGHEDYPVLTRFSW